MYGSLLRDEPLLPTLQHLLRDFYRRTRAAIGHALAFPTWHSLTHKQGLADDDAVALMSLLVEGTAHARPREVWSRSDVHWS
jgi:hypothetical protein